MSNHRQSQGKKAGGESPLEDLLEKTGLNSWEELAAMISVKSGQKISGSTLRRHAKKGWDGWLSLGLSIVQMDVVCELTGMRYEELPRQVAK